MSTRCTYETDEQEILALREQRDELLAALRDIHEWCLNGQRSTGIKPYGLDVAAAAIAKAQS
jgi:hypothetical protein